MDGVNLRKLKDFTPWACNAKAFELQHLDYNPMRKGGFRGNLYNRFDSHSGSAAYLANSAISKMINTVQDEKQETT